MRSHLPILALFLGFSLSVARAEDVSAEQVKQALQRAVPALMDHKDKTIREQVTGQGGCVSCHWSGAAIFAVSMAQRRGLVDRKEVAKFDQMLQKHTTPKLVYELNDRAITVLKTDGLAADRLATLNKKKNQRFNTPKDLLTVLAKDGVESAMLEKHEAEILKVAANPHFYETGDNAIGGASILLAGASAATARPEAVAKGLVDRLLRAQQKDGSFNQGGQPFFPCDGKEQAECQTLWVAMALRSIEPKSDAATQCLERANTYLQKTKPGTSTVTLLLRTLWAHGNNDAATVGDFSAAFLKQQRADGGWSIWNWSKGDYESDAFATGMAVYTLATIGRPATDTNVQRGLAFLLKNQDSDGSWSGANSKGKAVRIWSYWNTTWAFVGLAETRPR
jgi:hypothetical protein